MAPEAPETEAASSLVGSQGRRVAGLIVAVVAPVTLITALAYYFGYRREEAFAGYFGIDPSTLGFTTNDYVLRSVDALFVPVTVLLLVAFGAVFLHALAGDRFERVELRPVAVVVGLCALILGIALLAGKPIAHHDTVFGKFTIPSLEIAGPGGHWVEVSRALGTPSAEVQRMVEAYEEYYEVAQTALRAGATAHDVHRAVSAGFTQRGYHLGHVTGHSIGMTMIEHPRIGEGIDTELAANMVFSMHPHAIAADGVECLYMQDTWLVTEDGGVPLAGLEMRIY